MNSYINKLENLEEMDKFLDIYNLPKLSHEDTESLNWKITNKNVESVTKILPKKQSS
jgi:hypothetical protein